MRLAILLTVVMTTVLGLTSQGIAAVMFSTGAGSAVTVVDRMATFDSLSGNGIDLTSYSEGGLDITVPDTTFIGFDPFLDGTLTQFHYGTSGNSSFVTIQGSDSAAFRGVEFKFGDGFFSTQTSGVSNLLWETRLLGVVTGSGLETSIPLGSIVGWSDLGGFDELRIASNPSFTLASSLGDFQAIALDDVVAQLTTSAIPEPTSMALLGLTAAGFCGVRLRRRQRFEKTETK